MSIIINFLENTPYKMELYHRLVQQYWLNEALQNSTETYIWITDAAIADLPKNVELCVQKNIATNIISNTFFYTRTLPKIVKKHQASHLVHIYGKGVVGSKITQTVLTPYIPAVTPTFKRTFSPFYSLNTLSFTNEILCTSHYQQQMLEQQYPAYASKISVIQLPTLNTIKPIDEWEQKQAIKDGFADGREYFINIGNYAQENDWLVLLKAFSQFKKWQNSSMKLVLVAAESTGIAALKEKLSLYKYRNDVVLFESMPTNAIIANVIGAAYAAIFTQSNQQHGCYLHMAMQASIPIIGVNSGCTQEITNDAAQLVADGDIEAVTNLLKLYYRDEQLKHAMAIKSQKRAAELI